MLRNKCVHRFEPTYMYIFLIYHKLVIGITVWKPANTQGLRKLSRVLVIWLAWVRRLFEVSHILADGLALCLVTFWWCQSSRMGLAIRSGSDKRLALELKRSFSMKYSSRRYDPRVFDARKIKSHIKQIYVTYEIWLVLK